MIGTTRWLATVRKTFPPRQITPPRMILRRRCSSSSRSKQLCLRTCCEKKTTSNTKHCRMAVVARTTRKEALLRPR
ncbi:unnamed protein product [Amoebophrya sp. A120]|nr:unnamed protein product [Amoebophrya sp. A120]|eukprot:GSA120T00023884001.1